MPPPSAPLRLFCSPVQVSAFLRALNEASTCDLDVALGWAVVLSAALRVRPARLEEGRLVLRGRAQGG